jgi:hypothetical protein
VPAGTVGDLFPGGTYSAPSVTASGPNAGDVATNLYVDTNDDLKYLNFGNGGRYIGANGDTIWFSGPDDPTLADLGGDPDAKVWAWVGLASTESQQATVSAVNEQPLTDCN